MARAAAFLKSVVPAGAAGPLRAARNLCHLGIRDFRREVLALVWPAKPTAISVMANDVCNSRCEMCLIWKKREKGPPLEELRRMLSDPLFNEVVDFGLTGGEPTLRPDLPEIYRTAIECLPRLANVSIITNAIQPTLVTERILASFEVCRAHGVGFSAMVSLDGLGGVHDAVRGRRGNFESALRCIDALRIAGVAVSIGCTITRTNAYQVDELLEWAIEQQLPARFRVAEFIDRLYNGEQHGVIRNFEPLIAYHLGLFFSRLATQYERNQAVGKTYMSVRGMLAEGKPRTTGCPYHHEAVVLTAQREMLYCSPKSPVLGNMLRAPGVKIFFGNLHKRKQIRQKHCDDCIHDYHVPPTFIEKVSFWVKCTAQRRKYVLETLVARANRLRPSPAVMQPARLQSRSVLIVGWYGTETIGDKAILWGIIHKLRERPDPPTRIVVASFHPFVTEWTKRELGIDKVEVVQTYSSRFEEMTRSVDEVVIGGGPLMDLQSLDHMLYAFIAAAREGSVTRIEGCGIGPLEDSRYIATVRAMARLASHISLRDEASVQRARTEFGSVAECVEDPAVLYLRDRIGHASPPATSARTELASTASFFLRELPKEYVSRLDADRIKELRDRFENEILKFMAQLNATGMKLRLLPMCHMWEGGDDRIFNRRLLRRLVSDSTVPQADIDVELLPVAPENIVSAMRGSSLNLCMRYHSVVFAETLNTEYIAIDYTGGGKIRAFLEDRGKLDRLITLQDFAAGGWRGSLERLLPRLKQLAT